MKKISKRKLGLAILSVAIVACMMFAGTYAWFVRTADSTISGEATIKAAYISELDSKVFEIKARDISLRDNRFATDRRTGAINQYLDSSYNPFDTKVENFKGDVVSTVVSTSLGNPWIAGKTLYPGEGVQFYVDNYADAKFPVIHDREILVEVDLDDFIADILDFNTTLKGWADALISSLGLTASSNDIYWNLNDDGTSAASFIIDNKYYFYYPAAGMTGNIVDMSDILNKITVDFGIIGLNRNQNHYMTQEIKFDFTSLSNIVVTAVQANRINPYAAVADVYGEKAADALAKYIEKVEEERIAAEEAAAALADAIEAMNQSLVAWRAIKQADYSNSSAVAAKIGSKYSIIKLEPGFDGVDTATLNETAQFILDAIASLELESGKVAEIIDAITALGAGDDITLPAGKIDLGDTVIPEGVTIKGAGSDVTTISIGGVGELLKVDGDATFEDLTIAGNGVSQTGAFGLLINSGDTVTLNDVVIKDITANSGTQGVYAIYVNGGNLIMNGGKIENCQKNAIEIDNGGNAIIDGTEITVGNSSLVGATPNGIVIGRTATSSATITNVTINGFKYYDSNVVGSTGSTAIYVFASSSATVADTTISGTDNSIIGFAGNVIATNVTLINTEALDLT